VNVKKLRVGYVNTSQAMRLGFRPSLGYSRCLCDYICNTTNPMRDETIEKSKYSVSTMPNLRTKSPRALRTDDFFKKDHTLLNRRSLRGVFLNHGLNERLHELEAALFAHGVIFGLTLDKI
jgi:hypothetical protein